EREGVAGRVVNRPRRALQAGRQEQVADLLLWRQHDRAEAGARELLDALLPRPAILVATDEPVDDRKALSRVRRVDLDAVERLPVAAVVAGHRVDARLAVLAPDEQSERRAEQLAGEFRRLAAFVELHLDLDDGRVDDAGHRESGDDRVAL